MSSIEQRLEYLEEANDVLRMQNHVLSTAFKALTAPFPPTPPKSRSSPSSLHLKTPWQN
ncbi:Uncharacterised protein [Neisseria meningitidis]|nr:Uncharacterised protein [Neisseria meningitidis]